MQKSNREVAFQRSINPLTLSFHDQFDESDYRLKLSKSLHLPRLFKIMAFLCHVILFSYRVYALIIASLGVKLECGTFWQEAINLVIYIVVLLVEAAIKFFGKFRRFQGLFLYNYIPMMCFSAAFYTNNEPRFGIP